jgi:Flp pilus assembly protein TadG
VCARRTPLRTFRDDARGATALEFAIVLPIFLVIMYGVFQFGWAQHKLSSIRFAMETASRSLLLDPTMTEAQLTALVTSKLSGGSTDPNVSISLSISDTAGAKIARLTGAYSTQVGVPLLATYPVQWTTTVSTALPAA